MAEPVNKQEIDETFEWTRKNQQQQDTYNIGLQVISKWTEEVTESASKYSIPNIPKMRLGRNRCFFLWHPTTYQHINDT